MYQYGLFPFTAFIVLAKTLAETNSFCLSLTRKEIRIYLQKQAEFDVRRQKNDMEILETITNLRNCIVGSCQQPRTIIYSKRNYQ